MKRYILLFLSFLGVLVHAPAICQERTVIDLASESDWTMQIDGTGEWFNVKVPYGGWNSDRQYKLLDENMDVKDYVTYKREVKAPSGIDKSIVKLCFGAVNFGAEVYVDDVMVCQHHSTFTSFETDVTKYLRAKKSCTVKVKAYVLNHYKNSEGKYTMPTGFIYADKNSKFPFGIARFVRMEVYPEVYISNVFVRPSVTYQQLSYDVTIANGSTKMQEVVLHSGLDCWNGKEFDYPELKDIKTSIDPGQSKTITISAPWQLGPDSYWWPNIPFSEDYVATLHNLTLSLTNTRGRQIYNMIQRFGFVEHAEGPYYYTVNGVRVNLPSDASAATQGCVYDAYSESDAFKYSSDRNSGCHLTWKKYMRLGIRANRTHQEPPTQNIMDAADEVGFILIPETAIRGSYYGNQEAKANEYYRQHIKDIVIECRNHPCVARYSLANEMGTIPALLDMAIPYDSTRPYVFESNAHDSSTRTVSELGHAYVMAHYVDFPRPANSIYGLGEFAWDTDGINEYATRGKLMRINDICYFSGWSWTNYWPNFLEGWSHDTYAWQQNNHADRHDYVDGWHSPIINYVIKSLDPFLIIDEGIEKMNCFNENWPTAVPYYKPGSPISRSIHIFNDDLKGDKIDFSWQFRWDSPEGELLEEHSKVLTIKPGFHAHETIDITAPEIGGIEERKLFLIMTSRKDGEVVFKEEKVWFNISDSEPVNDIQLIGTDTETHGNWNGKYGKDGYEVIGADSKIPGYADISYDRGHILLWGDATDDERALQRFKNDGDTGSSRIAASLSRYGTVSITLDIGWKYKKVAVYFMGWNTDHHLPVYVPETNSSFSVDNYQDGQYLIFKVRGKVTLVIGDERVSRVSGVFFDSL